MDNDLLGELLRFQFIELLALLLGDEQAAGEVREGLVFFLEADAYAVSLREVEVARELVGGVGEDVEAEFTLLVEFDRQVDVAGEVAAGATRRILAVTEVAAEDDAAVEELGGHRDVEEVLAGTHLLVAESHVDRDLETLEDVVELAGHDFHHVGVQQGGLVEDAGVLVGQEGAEQQEGHELFLDLVARAQGRFDGHARGRIQVGHLDRKVELGGAQAVAHVDDAVDRAARQVARAQHRVERGAQAVGCIDVQLGVHHVAVELDGAAALDGEVLGQEAREDELVGSFADVVVAVQVENGPGRAQGEGYGALAADGRHVAGFLVDFHEGVDARLDGHPAADGDVRRRDFLLLHVGEHLFVRVELADRLREGQQLVAVAARRGGGAGGRGDVHLAGAGGIDVRIHVECCQRAAGVGGTRGAQVTVVGDACAFRRIQDLQVAELHTAVDREIFQVLVTQGTVEGHAAAVVVQDGHVVHVDAVLVDPERAADSVGDAGEPDPGVGVVDVQVVAIRDEVVRRTGHADVAADAAAQLRDGVGQEGGGDGQREAIQRGVEVEALLLQEIAAADAEGVTPVDMVNQVDAEVLAFVLPLAGQGDGAGIGAGEAQGVEAEVHFHAHGLLRTGGDDGLAVHQALDVELLRQELVDERQVKAVHVQGEGVAVVRGETAVHFQALRSVADQEMVQQDVVAVLDDVGRGEGPGVLAHHDVRADRVRLDDQLAVLLVPEHAAFEVDGGFAARTGEIVIMDAQGEGVVVRAERDGGVEHGQRAGPQLRADDVGQQGAVPVVEEEVDVAEIILAEGDAVGTDAAVQPALVRRGQG